MKKFKEEYDKFHKKHHNKHQTATGYHKALKQDFKDWVSPEDHQAVIKKFKSQLEKQQPEIPEFVAKAVMEINLEYLFNGFTNGINEKAKEWLKKHKGVKSLGYYVCQLRFQGFKVAKEKRFYLKNKLTGGYIAQDCYNGTRETYNLSARTEFTQQEIDSMETGSYEPISVEES